ncbi:hypothetical protein D3C74_326880 [compost metagenome]
MIGASMMTSASLPAGEPGACWGTFGTERASFDTIVPAFVENDERTWMGTP